MEKLPRTSHSEPLKATQYFSPYTRSGAPGVPISTEVADPYAPLRKKALETLEAMGFDPVTMVERGVTWAEDQDPFGHVMHSQYQHYFGICWQRIMEFYGAYLTEQEYRDMLSGKGVIPVLGGYEIRFKRQVKHPDTLIVASRQLGIEPNRAYAHTGIFSLQQQAIVAETKGHVTYIDAKTGRPTDITKYSDGWRSFYKGMTEKVNITSALVERWEADHPAKRSSKM
ncbi:hypothetical protein LEL_06148 [Akanthomyces lecanii RCEF 1005]|uniref:Uncharacterized protein n=1 Tax=Akanthomyces lecanii RCEF 1005 TaxID=1081108 RepID=A0A168GGL4_CORDF|nr:hypothetical protein LEL_06148 [Akanthomyces lecanii RCEF 1005]